VALDPAQGVDADQTAELTGDLRVLLVDDSAVVRVFAARLLEFAGHRVDVVTDGRQAVQAVRGGEYDLILMDVYMPDMNGIEATIALRAGGCTLPILALSGSVADQDFKDCLDAGMSGALRKPFTLEAFEQECRRIRRPGGDSRELSDVAL
jgi:two-component system, sensor histidine kinase and response regulator